MNLGRYLRLAALTLADRKTPETLMAIVTPIDPTRAEVRLVRAVGSR